MASLADMLVSVVKASPIDDHSTYQYHIRVQYGGTSWEVAKRFSEFDKLLQSLGASKYAGLPKMPAKTLIGAPTDQAAVEGRKAQLKVILYDLLLRPDTRTSQQMRLFLQMESHIETVTRSLQPDALRTFEDPRFGVSGLCIAPDAKLLLVTHEDSTHLSRLGRVWSVVEPDELGALHLWTQASDGAWKRAFSRTYGIKVRSLAWEDTTRQFFVGLEDGKVEVYHIPEDSLSLQPSSDRVLELHHNSPVTHLSVSSRRLLSLGFDTAMRVIDIRTKELLCGGRLMKRLKNEMDYLTSGYLDCSRDRAFIGTSGGDMFILEISKNPPNFLHTITLGESPIAAITLNQETLLVAHSDCIQTFSFEEKGAEQKTTKKGAHRCKHLPADEVSILSMTAAPHRQLIFGGYSDGSVAIWSSRDREASVVLRAHQCDTTNMLWVEEIPWGPALLTGGGDGKITTWNLAGNVEDYAFWTPQGVAVEDFAINATSRPAAGSVSGTLDTLSAFDPSFGGAGGGYAGAGGSSDPFQMQIGGGNARVNPQALKSADDTDSDNDDIVGAFR